jgi:hypothetical protein
MWYILKSNDFYNDDYQTKGMMFIFSPLVFPFWVVVNAIIAWGKFCEYIGRLIK